MAPVPPVRLAVCPLLLAASVSCGSSSEQGDAGGPCRGSTSGTLVGDFSGCIVTLNHYADGDPLVGGRTNTLFTLLVNELAGATLPQDIESIGLDFELEGTPQTGTFALSGSFPGAMHLGFASGTAGGLYDQLETVELRISSFESFGESTLPSGGRAESFGLDGSVTMVVVDTAGTGSVEVSATF